VLALPSQGEVFPLAVLEALAAGTPVVMTDESALRIPDSQFALKQIHWKDTSAIGRAVRALAADRPERSKVQALVARFTWQRVATELVNCYEEMLGVANFQQNQNSIDFIPSNHGIIPSN
jgi:glycosyltransferase involved in cell wall biosynthesis